MRNRPELPVVTAFALLLVSSSHAARAQTPAEEAAREIAAGDAAWARRAEGAVGSVALHGPIGEAIAGYRRAVAADPESLLARARLMRAIYFDGEHRATDREERKKVFDEGKRIGEGALERIRRNAAVVAKKDLSKANPVELVPFLAGDRDALAAFLWAGVDWGKWALVFGKGAAVKQGAAAKIRDYATAVIWLDPSYEDGGGYRVLGRLHHQTPAVPFLTGWASRDAALVNLRRAVQAGPGNLINRLYLAEATWDYEKAKRGEARKMLEEIASTTPSDDFRLEDLRTQEEAKALLATWSR